MTGHDIRKARWRAKETQEQFAKRCGVKRNTISQWETDGPPGEGAARALLERVLAEIAAEHS